MGKLKVGDWVRLKSGGKVMTVVEVYRLGHAVKFSWVGRDRVRRTALFREATLKRVRDAKSRRPGK